MKKRLLSLILALIMIFSLFPASAFAEGKNEQMNAEQGVEVLVEADKEAAEEIADATEDISAETENETVEEAKPQKNISDYTDEDWNDPGKLEKIEDILSASLAGAETVSGTCGENLTWTLDEDGVLKIEGTGTMYDYDYDYDNSVPSTAPWYKHNNSISSVIIEDGVTSIGDRAFYDCTSLSSIALPNSVVSIGNSACVRCDSLTSVTIPSSITSIMGGAFVACSHLLEINVSPDNSCYYSIDGILFNKDQTELICCPAEKRGSYVIPSSVRAIESAAFFGCSNLTSITIPSGVTSIGSSAFCDCSNLTSITIPSGVTSIGSSAFYSCSKLTSITIPESVKSIGASAFEYCSSLTNITIPSSVTSIGGWAFCWCTSLTNITIPSSVTSIEEITFASCTNLTNVTIMPGVTSIGYSAFVGCTSLTSITIPSSVTSIGDYAFQICDSIKDVYYSGTEAQRRSINIGKTNDNLLNATWHYESAPVTGGKCGDNVSWTLIDGVLTISGTGPIFDYDYNSVPWNGLRNSITSVVIENNIISIGNYAFYDCGSLTSVTIPGSVTSIGDYAFAYCESLANVTIPSSMTSIGDRAFLSCTGLTSVTIQDGVTSIGDRAFQGCIGLASITIPGSVTSIGERAFVSCTGLASVTIQDGVTNIGKWTFDNCTSLTEIAVSEGNTNYRSIDGVLFNKAGTELTLYPQGLYGSYTIPDSVTRIGNDAFDNCTGLTSVAIPSSVRSIDEGAFRYCSNLKTIVFCGGAPEFSDYALETLECDCLYPDGDESWENIVSGNEQFGGTVTWLKYGDSFIEGNILTPQYFPDSNLLSRLKTMFGGYLSATSASKVYELNVSNSGIRNLAGIEVFENLSRLDCSMNSISNLNTDAFTYLWRLNCSHNNLTSLNVINNAELNTLDCSNNDISSLNLPEPYYYSRMSLNCSNNSLSSLPAIDYSELICFGNHLSRLDLSSGMYLRRFECSPQILYLNDIYSGVQMADIVGGDDLARVSAGNGCTYNPATGILTAEGSENGINYCYDVDGNGVLMSVYLSCLQIKKQPKSVTVNAGDTVVLEFEAEGNVSYKWECRYLNWDWEPARDFNTGYTSSTLELREVTPELNNYRFKCIAFNENGESVVSDVVAVSVTQEYSLTFMSGDHGSHGQLSASAYYDNQSHTEKIRAGETVSISVQADEGYLPTRPVVTAANGALVAVYDNGSYSLYFNGNLYPNDTYRRYSFVMPASDVTISETFSASKTCRKVTADAGIQHGTIIFSSGRQITVQEPNNLIYIVMNPDAGYIFDAVNSKITIEGKSGTDYSKSVMISADGQAAFPMPDEDVAVSVSFVEAPSDGQCGENIFWWLENGVLYLTGSGEMSDTATARNAWQAKKDEITSIVVGEGITGIGNGCFGYYLDKVASVSLPSTMKTIGSCSFYGCTALSSVAFPEGLESIGAEAFYNTDLTSVFIPKSVHEIGSGAFDCRNLSKINVDPENSAYCDVEGILFTKDRKTLLQYPPARRGAFYEVPEEVENIEYSAFGAPRYLKTLFIHDSIKSISTGQSYFSTTVKQIDYEGSEEQWHNAIIHVGYELYNFSNLTVNYNVKAVTIESIAVTKAPDKTRYIEGEMFDSTGMVVTAAYSNGFTDEVTGYSFSPLDALTKENTTVTVSYQGKTATTPITVLSGTFGVCGDNVRWTLSEGILTISGTGPMYDYNNNTVPWDDSKDSITSVIIKNGVTAIGRNAFSGCSGVKQISFEGTAPTFGNDCFSGVTATVCYPAGDSSWKESVKQSYGGELSWHMFGDISGDDDIDVQDVFAVREDIAGRTPMNAASRSAADVYRDGRVDLIDASFVMRYIVGFVETLPIP